MSTLSMQNKIAFLVGDIDKSGGTERVTSIMASALVSRGYEVLIITMKGMAKPFFPLPDSVEIVGPLTNVKRLLPVLPKISFRLRGVVRHLDIDTLVVVDTISVIYSLPALYGLNVRHIAWEHFNFKNNNGKVVRSLARRMAKLFCSDIVVLTEKDQSSWLKGFASKARIHTIPNPAPSLSRLAKIEQEKRVVLSLGRPVYTKGFDILVEAWLCLNEDFPDWQLLIVGLEEDERSLLRAQISDSKGDASVLLLPRTNDVASLYSRAEVYCLASRHEGFPMVLLEAMANSLAILSVNCETGPSDILSDYPIELVKSEDAKSLAVALREVMQNDKLRESAKVAGRNLVGRYQVGEIVSKWEALFSS